MRSSLIFNNFTVGKIDNDLCGRFELPFYSKGFQHCENFFSNYKGVLKNRTGFEFVEKSNMPIFLKEFKFNKDQSYLLVFKDLKVSFYTYDVSGKFGSISADGGFNSLHGFTSNNSENVEFSDNKNNEKTYTIFNYDDPVENLSEDINGGWIQIKFSKKVHLTKYILKRIWSESLSQYIGPNSFVLQGSDDGVVWNNIETKEGLDNKDFVESNISSKEYYFYWRFANMTSYYLNCKIKLFGEYKEKVKSLPTGISYENLCNSSFAQNGDVLYITNENFKPKKITRYSSDSFKFEDVDIKGVDFDKFGYPRCCAFYSGRLWLGGFKKMPVTVCASETANYDNFQLTTENINSDDPLQFTLSDISDPILWLFGGKDNLNVGNSEGISVVNGGGSIISPTSVNASIANKDGGSSVYPCQKENLVFYSSVDGRRLFAYGYDLLSESFLSTDMSIINQDVTTGLIKKIVYKQDENDLIYILFHDGTLCSFLFNQKENIRGFFPIKTYGNVIDIEVLTRHDGKKDLFAVVEYEKYLGTFNHFDLLKLSDEVVFSNYYNTNYFDDKNKEKYERKILKELQKCNYLDCSYSVKNTGKNYVNVKFFDNNIFIISENLDFGKDYICSFNNDNDFFVFKYLNHVNLDNFYQQKKSNVKILKSSMPIKDIENLVGQPLYTPDFKVSEAKKEYKNFEKYLDCPSCKIYCFADGCCVDNIVVKYGPLSGEISIELPDYFYNVCFGYKYNCFAATFNIGNSNMQTAPKNIQKCTLRLINSAGGLIGTDLNDLQEIQLFSPSGFYDMSPKMLNGDVKINMRDSSSEEKFLYISQNKSLPFNLSMIKLDVEYGSD